MPVIDITDTYWVNTGEYKAAVAIAAVEAELDGNYDLAEQIRRDGAEARLLARI